MSEKKDERTLDSKELAALKDRLEQAPMYLCYAAVLCCMAALAASRQSFLMIGGLLLCR